MLFLFLFACSKDGDGDSLADTPEFTCVDVPQIEATSASSMSASGISYCSLDDGTFGYMNRESGVACAGDPEDTLTACPHGMEDCGGCPSGQACGLSPYGTSCGCYTLCGSDADCSADEACVCALGDIDFDKGVYDPGTIDQCVQGNCRTGADCASGECGATRFDCFEGGPISGFYCRTPEDECRTNQDCSEGYEVCQYATKLARWTCSKGAICD